MKTKAAANSSKAAIMNNKARQGMGPRRRRSVSEKKAAVKAVAAGSSRREVARRMGVSEQTVGNWIKEAHAMAQEGPCARDLALAEYQVQRPCRFCGRDGIPSTEDFAAKGK